MIILWTVPESSGMSQKCSLVQIRVVRQIMIIVAARQQDKAEAKQILTLEARGKEAKLRYTTTTTQVCILKQGERYRDRFWNRKPDVRLTQS